MKLGSQMKTLALALALAGSAATASAQIVNPGFESGLTGWNVFGTPTASVSAVSSFLDQLPPAGQLMALMDNGGAFSNSPFAASVLLQATTAALTAPMVAWVNFLSTEFPNTPQFNDTFTLFASGGAATASIQLDTFSLTQATSNPDVLMSGWRKVSLPVGTNFLQMTITDAGGFSASPSFALIDIVAAPVPEPSTYAMLLAGLGLLGCAARKRMPG